MDGDFQPTTQTLPGTAFHAPQVRLVTEAGAPVTQGGKPVSPDIVSAKVTLLVSGVGQVEIVLNNQRHDDANRPVVPSWRYNGLREVGFGKRLRVDMRYGVEGWTPMILARVTDMTFAFPQAGGALVTLKGDDLVSLLRVSPDEDMIYIDYHEVDMVSDVLQSSGSGMTLSNPPAPEFSQPMEGLTRKKSVTYLKFIEDLAERMDYEIYAAFDDASPGTPGAGASAADARTVGFHFEPARSATLNAVVPLKWGRDIVEFAPSFTVWDMLTKVTARASVPRERGEIEAEATLDGAINDLHASPSGGPTPLAAGAARAAAFGDENHPEDNATTIPVPDLDTERAALAASAKLRASARKFLTADITTIGFTRLRPGIHVDLSGFSAPFDGVWYVTRTVHTLNASGYLTVSSLRRPGMLDPAGYPGA
jgi:hypothetical protein